MHGCLLRSKERAWRRGTEVWAQKLNTQPGPGNWESVFLPSPPSTPIPSPFLLLSIEVGERGLPEVETFLNKSFNFSHVDTAALTQRHVWGMVSRKPGTMECFSTGTHNGWLLRVVLCSVLSMWCLNWTFSWPLKGNNFKRKNFKSAKSQIMAQDRKSKGFVGFILKYKSLNASKQQPPENVKFNVWG